MAALSAIGVDRALIERAGLGVKEPYTTAQGAEVAGVVTYPLSSDGLRRRYGYINLPGYTCNPDHKDAWSAGAARSLDFGSASVLLVVANPLKVFQARAAIERLGLDIAVRASSQPDAMPKSWEKAKAWVPWTRVVVEQAVPAAVTAAIVAAASRPVETAQEVALRFDGNIDAIVSIAEWLSGTLEAARPCRPVASSPDPLGTAIGDFPASPISLHGGFAKGHLYYPFTVERRRSEAGAMLCYYETLVVRGDGAILQATTLNAPAGTPADRRVQTLTDGTRIGEAPQQSRNATWSFPSIERFVADRSAGREPLSRSPAEIIADVHRHLEGRVILPSTDDLWVAAAFVAMTHMFRVFGAIPLLLVEGPRGSGKSELANAVSALSFNAVTMGQGSAAALVRLSRECGGLIVLDDVEGLAGSTGGFGELGQCLKVGYRSSTARKPITMGSGRVRTFDFFGPRLLTCTRGVDPVLASRCIRITTSPAETVMPGIKQFSDTDSLRDELHCLGMTQAGQLATALKDFRPLKRSDEIWAPLECILERFAPGEPVAALRRARDRHEG